MKIKAQDLDDMRKALPTGTTLITVFRGVSDSGMTRWFDVYSVNRACGGERYPLLRWTYTAAGAIGATYDRKRESIKIGGCGFSAPLEIVSSLGRCLHQDANAFTFQEL